MRMRKAMPWPASERHLAVAPTQGSRVGRNEAGVSRFGSADGVDRVGLGGGWRKARG